MAAGDAKAVPVKNVALRVTFPILDADGDLVTGAAGLDSEVSIDAGTFADCTNEATEIATASGMYYLDLTSTEMNGDTISIIVKTSTVGAKTTPMVIYTAARNINDLAFPTTSGRSIDVTATGGVGIDWANVENPTTTLNLSGTSTKALEPTTAGRTLDVTATGAAGVDWGNLENPTTANGLTGTTISTSQVVASVTGAVGSVTGAVGSVTGNVGGNVTGSVASVTARVTANTDQLAGQPVTAAAGVTFPTSVASPTNITAGTITTVTNLTNAPTAGDFTAVMKTSLNAATPASVVGAVGSVTGNVGGNVVGSVGSVTGNVGGNVTGSVGSVVAGVDLSAAGVDAVLDDAVDGTTTVRQSLRLANSANGAKLSGAATATVVIRDLADTKNRVTATVDASGNRTAVTTDLT